MVFEFQKKAVPWIIEANCTDHLRMQPSTGTWQKPRWQVKVKKPVLPHVASSKEKAILAIHPRSSGWGILAFSRKYEDTIHENSAEWQWNSFKKQALLEWDGKNKKLKLFC